MHVGRRARRNLPETLGHRRVFIFDKLNLVLFQRFTMRFLVPLGVKVILTRHKLEGGLRETPRLKSSTARNYLVDKKQT